MEYLEKQFKEVRALLESGREFDSFAAGKIYVQKAFAQRLSDMTGSDARFLEVGCGGSLTLHFLSQIGHEAVGLDSSDVALDYSSYLRSQLGSDIQVLKGDAFALPYDDGHFDCVYSIGMIEHYRFEDQVRLCREMLRVASRFLVIGVPNVRPASASYHYVMHGDEHHEECDIQKVADSIGLGSAVYDGRGIFLSDTEARKNPDYFRFLETYFPERPRTISSADIQRLIELEALQEPEMRRNHGFIEYFIGARR